MKFMGGARVKASVILSAIVMLALALVLVATLPAGARAQSLYEGSGERAGDALESLNALYQARDTGAISSRCGTSVTFSGTGWRCSSGSEGGAWTTAPLVSVDRTFGIVFICRRRIANEQCRPTEGGFSWVLAPTNWAYVCREPVDCSLDHNAHIRNVREVSPSILRAVDAIAFLSSRRQPLDPATDAAFASAIQAALASPADTEGLRRVQVQAEAALNGNRTIEAARLFRDALRTQPRWADGHYNLALVYGALELYPEAITELRRYLHLSPNAPDARAVQDQIYQWEALLPAQ